MKEKNEKATRMLASVADTLHRVISTTVDGLEEGKIAVNVMKNMMENWGHNILGK